LIWINRSKKFLISATEIASDMNFVTGI